MLRTVHWWETWDRLSAWRRVCPTESLMAERTVVQTVDTLATASAEVLGLVLVTVS